MKIEKHILTPRYKKDNGVFVLDTQGLQFPDKFQVAEQSIVYIPPLQIAGNHRHPRMEAFIGIGMELVFHWQDEAGRVHTEKMQDENLYVIFVPSMIPHAIRNESSSSFGILYEYANEAIKDVERMQLI